MKEFTVVAVLSVLAVLSTLEKVGADGATDFSDGCASTDGSKGTDFRQLETCFQPLEKVGSHIWLAGPEAKGPANTLYFFCWMPANWLEDSQMSVMQLVRRQSNGWDSA